MTISNLMLQWCNEVESVFSEVRRVNKPGALFLFSSFGPDTLKELRESWAEVDNDVHVNDFPDMHDIGDALVRAGFEDPVMEVEYFTLTYESVPLLFRELKLLGAGNANNGRRQTLTGKGRLKLVMEAYEKYRTDSRIPVTYEAVYGHAWNGAGGIRRMPGGDSAYAVPISAIKRKKE